MAHERPRTNWRLAYVVPIIRSGGGPFWAPFSMTAVRDSLKISVAWERSDLLWCAAAKARERLVYSSVSSEHRTRGAVTARATLQERPQSVMLSRVIRWCMWLAALLLVGAASLKLVSLHRVDVRLAVQLRWPSIVFPLLSEMLLVKAVVCLEYAIAAVLLFNRNDHLRLSLLTWISTVFLAYHFSLYTLGEGASCHCLGTWSGSSQRTFDSVGLIVLGILVVIGWGGLAIQGWPWLCAKLRAK